MTSNTLNPPKHAQRPGQERTFCGRPLKRVWKWSEVTCRMCRAGIDRAYPGVRLSKAAQTPWLAPDIAAGLIAHRESPRVD